MKYPTESSALGEFHVNGFIQWVLWYCCRILFFPTADIIFRFLWLNRISGFLCDSRSSIDLRSSNIFLVTKKSLPIKLGSEKKLYGCGCRWRNCVCFEFIVRPCRASRRLQKSQTAPSVFRFIFLSQSGTHLPLGIRHQSIPIRLSLFVGHAQKEPNFCLCHIISTFFLFAAEQVGDVVSIGRSDDVSNL